MITLNNNNLEITEGTFQSDSRTMLSSPSVTPEMDDNMNIWFTLEQYKMISTIKIYKSYPMVDGKYRFGIKTPSEDNRFHIIWAKNEDEAFKKSYKENYGGK